jgi:hypothetical protein
VPPSSNERHVAPRITTPENILRRLCLAMAFRGRLSALLVLTAIYGTVAQNATNTTYDVLSYVNQLIGSSNGGS